jgi:hypothetical protein
VYLCLPTIGNNEISSIALYRELSFFIVRTILIILIILFQIAKVGVILHQDDPWYQSDLGLRQWQSFKLGLKTDVTIFFRDNESIQCHSYPLIVSSPKLTAMLNGNLNKLQLPEVKLSQFLPILE